MANILIIDDDPQVLAANAAALAAGGHAVRTASGWTVGRAAIVEAAPDLVVFEPLVEGAAEPLERVRRLAAAYPAIPIIVLTRTVLHDGHDRDGGWLPVHRYMEKPVAPEVLHYEVDHLLEELEGAHAATPRLSA